MTCSAEVDQRVASGQHLFSIQHPPLFPASCQFIGGHRNLIRKLPGSLVAQHSAPRLIDAASVNLRSLSDQVFGFIGAGDPGSGVYESFPDVQMIAEESTAWPMVSRPTYLGGLGFGLKWDMGWMHDTLKYLSHDPIHRKFHHTQITFRMMYAFTENFLLPLSHDEVVHGKGSLIRKMPGNDAQKFANLRLLLAYQFAQSGKKLLFMGGEFGQDREWNHDSQLDWDLLDDRRHRGVALLIRDLNQLYRTNPAMHRFDESQEGFEWIDATDVDQSVVTFMRKGEAGEPPVVMVFNFTPISRAHYRIGVPHYTFWKEVINTDAEPYGGTGAGNMGGVAASPIGYHNHLFSLTLTLPPLSALFLTSADAS